MDDLENIPWSEEGLSSLKYNDLKEIAKQKNVVIRNRKKVELIRALIECNSQSKNAEFKEPIPVQIMDLDKAVINTPRLPTPSRRLTLSTGKRNYWLRGNLKNDSPLQCVIPEQDEGFYNQSAIVTDVTKDLINTPKATSDRRLTFSTGKKNKNLRRTSRNVSTAEFVNSEKDKQLQILTDVDKTAINTTKISPSDSNRRLTFSPERKNKRLRSTLKNASLLNGVIPEETDKQPEVVTVIDEKVMNTPDSVQPDRHLTLSTGRKSMRLKSISRKASPVLEDVTSEHEEMDIQLTTTNSEEVSLTEKNIVDERRNSLQSGTVGSDRRSTFLKEDKGSEEISLTEKSIVEEERNSLQSGTVGSDRRSTYLKEDKDESLRSSSSKASLVNSFISKQEEDDIQSSAVTELQDSDCVIESVMENPRSSLKSVSVGKDRRSMYPTDDKDVDKGAINTPKVLPLDLHRQLMFSTEKKNVDKGAVNTPNVLPLDSDRQLMFSTEKKNRNLRSSSKFRNDTPKLDCVIPEEGANTTDRQSPIVTVIDEKVIDTPDSVQPDRHLTLSSGRKSMRSKSISRKASPVSENVTSQHEEMDIQLTTTNSEEVSLTEKSIVDERRNSLQSGTVGSDRRSTFLKENKELQDSDCVIECVIENPRSSLKSGSVGKDRRSTYLTDGKENDSSILHRELESSFIENEEGSLIRITPFKEDTPSIRFNKSGEMRKSVISRENDNLIARVSPLAAIQKKGVKFQLDDTFEKGSITRVTPRKTIVKTPHKVKVLQSSNTPCGKNVARNAQQSSAKMPSAKKMPNFSAIHKKRFKKMESLIDMKKRFAEKARKMLCSPDVPRCAVVNQNVTNGSPFESNLVPTATPSSSKNLPTTTSVCKTPSLVKKVPTSTSVRKTPSMKNVPTTSVPKSPASTKINRFGFKPRMTMDYAKQIINRDVPVPSESKKVEQRGVLQGVRLNRRFTLQMQARGLLQ